MPSDNWSHKKAYNLAKKENIILTDQHWIIINFVRSFYQKFHLLPNLRIIITELQKEHTINSIYIYRLFPQHPLKQISIIGGLPLPIHCL
jgi:tRNA 2-thiouridine synthesizing protein E